MRTNYATHKRPKVRAWLERHPRFHVQFTPTSALWLNAVEGFFATLEWVVSGLSTKRTDTSPMNPV